MPITNKEKILIFIISLVMIAGVILIFYTIATEEDPDEQTIENDNGQVIIED